MLDDAQALFGAGRTVDALAVFDDAAAIDSDNAEALAYGGWIVSLGGLTDEAMLRLDRAVAAEPSFPDAHFFRGMVLYQDRKDPANAVTEFRLFLSNNPPQEMVPLVEDVLRRAMADAGQPVP